MHGQCVWGEGRGEKKNTLGFMKIYPGKVGNFILTNLTRQFCMFIILAHFVMEF